MTVAGSMRVIRAAWAELSSTVGLPPEGQWPGLWANPENFRLDEFWHLLGPTIGLKRRGAAQADFVQPGLSVGQKQEGG